jgi:hypothetical protein
VNYLVTLQVVHQLIHPMTYLVTYIVTQRVIPQVNCQITHLFTRHVTPGETMGTHYEASQKAHAGCKVTHTLIYQVKRHAAHVRLHIHIVTFVEYDS